AVEVVDRMGDRVVDQGTTDAVLAQRGVERLDRDVARIDEPPLVRAESELVLVDIAVGRGGCAGSGVGPHAAGPRAVRVVEHELVGVGKQLGQDGKPPIGNPLLHEHTIDTVQPKHHDSATHCSSSDSHAVTRSRSNSACSRSNMATYRSIHWSTVY